jgi:hypothetical protein
MWSNGAANTLALAKLVSAARESLRARGEWTRLWRVGLPRLPFCRRKAEMLAVIGRELGELSAQTFARMPSGWSPLYYLAKLGRRTVEKLIATGRIHPDLTLHQAKDLLAEFEPGRKRHGPGSVLHFRLARFVAFLERASPGWSPTERRLVRATLLRLAEQLAQPRAGMKTPSTAPVLTCNSDNFKSVQ